MKVEGVLNEITGNSLKARSNGKSSIGLLFYLDRMKGLVRRKKLLVFNVSGIQQRRKWNEEIEIWIIDVERYQNLSECVEWGRIRRKLNRKQA